MYYLLFCNGIKLVCGSINSIACSRLSVSGDGSERSVGRASSKFFFTRS